MNRIHPEDLRAIVAAILGGGALSDPNIKRLYHEGAVEDADKLLAELECTAKPEARAPVRTCSEVDETSDPPLFTLYLPSDALSGATERILFTSSALAQAAAMEKEGKIQGRIAQDNLELRAEVDGLKAELAQARDFRFNHLAADIAKAQAEAAREERERIIALLVDPDGSLGLTARDYPSPEEWGVLSCAADIRAAMEPKP